MSHLILIYKVCPSSLCFSIWCSLDLLIYVGKFADENFVVCLLVVKIQDTRIFITKFWPTKEHI